MYHHHCSGRTPNTYLAFLIPHQPSVLSQQLPTPIQLCSITAIQLCSISSWQLLWRISQSPPASFVQSPSASSTQSSPACFIHSTAATFFPSLLNHLQPSFLNTQPPLPTQLCSGTIMQICLIRICHLLPSLIEIPSACITQSTVTSSYSASVDYYTTSSSLCTGTTSQQVHLTGLTAVSS